MAAPYLICSTAQLNQVRNNMQSVFHLMANLNLAGPLFIPLGVDGTLFTGVFDGNNFDGGTYQIANMVIAVSTGPPAGLFAWVGDAGVVQNLAVTNATVTGITGVGALVGILQDFSSVINCSASGVVKGTQPSNGPDIDGWIGGLVGRCQTGGGVFHSSASATVTGGYGTGGLIGQFTGAGNVSNCWSSGSVYSLGTSSAVGGLIGDVFNLATVTSCYSTANVYGGAPVGGLFGDLTYDSVVFNSYATGAVSGYVTGNGNTGVGGLIGSVIGDNSIATNCYATGSVTGDAGTTLGGSVGQQDNTGNQPVATYWNSQTTGLASDAYGTAFARTTAQMKTQSNYVGWDFTNIWTINAGAYPTLR